MTVKFNSKAALAIFSIGMFAFSLGCQKDSKKTRIVGAKGGVGTDAAMQAQKAKCDLTQKICLEKNWVKLSELNAFNNYIKPVMEKYDADIKDLTKEESNFMSSIHQGKSWYLIGSDFKVLNDNNVLAVEMDGNNIISLQKKDMIIINKQIFDQKNEEGQARIIAQELATMMYLLRIDKSLNDKKMSAQDIEKISNIQKTIIDDGKKLDVKDFFKRLVDNGYDSKVFDVEKLKPSKPDNSESKNDNSNDKSKSNNTKDSKEASADSLQLEEK